MEKTRDPDESGERNEGEEQSIIPAAGQLGKVAVVAQHPDRTSPIKVSARALILPAEAVSKPCSISRRSGTEVESAAAILRLSDRNPSRSDR